MMKAFSIALLLSLFVPAAGLFAGEEEVMIVERLHNMRLKQQDEEHAIRINKFIQMNNTTQCTPVQQVRQRMNDIRSQKNAGEGMNAENVTINAGHENLNVTDNHGTINSDVNVQVINEGGSDIPCP
ncbi:MAG: hypothetical protein COV46_00815 [Deltaproteobacteria bacterium CG11_big_fil_rev_8_21_14_0_20_49_13]|nr:MAG: hypothetical protein COV46_00815 [Deltaproteobacteria bacterium CG11_big_fil_rev_8_21_14_0_20_49_13]